MYRIGERFPGKSILRAGTVDDFNLVEGELRPGIEMYVEDRVGWLEPAQGIKQVEGMMAVKSEREARAGGEKEVAGSSGEGARRYNL